jgi:anti-sigma B factor antagonist
MEHTLIDDVLVLVPLDARIEAANSAAFKGAVVDWIHKGQRKIVLDLIHVEFIDSSGLGAIISSLKNLGKDGDLALCGLSKPVMNLFRLTRMQRIFQLFESREEAVSKLAH